MADNFTIDPYAAARAVNDLQASLANNAHETTAQTKAMVTLTRWITGMTAVLVAGLFVQLWLAWQKVCTP